MGDSIGRAPDSVNARTRRELDDTALGAVV